MRYDTSAVRRQKRLLEEEDARELLKTGEYGILSMIATDGGGYGIPISYAWDGNEHIYFHCAPKGQKLEYLKANDKVSFCVVGKTQVLAAQFTTIYESVLVFGTIKQDISAEERMHALLLLLDKYSTEEKVMGIQYAEKMFPHTHILRLDIELVSGKCNKGN